MGWLIETFSPPIYAIARRRLAGLAGSGVDAEDCVQNVWAVFLQRIRDLEVTQQRCAPLIMSWLSRTFDLQYLNLVRTRARRTAAVGKQPPNGVPVSELPAQSSGIVTKVVRSEQAALLLEILESLDEKDRDVLQLRGIQQLPPREVAPMLGIDPNAVTQRYRRALVRLREQLPGSVFDLLADEPDDETGET